MVNLGKGRNEQPIRADFTVVLINGPLVRYSSPGPRIFHQVVPGKVGNANGKLNSGDGGGIPCLVLPIKNPLIGILPFLLDVSQLEIRDLWDDGRKALRDSPALRRSEALAY